MPGGDDPFRILGIAEDASTAEIRQAYRRAALRYHPDTCKGNPREAAQLFHAAHEAYKAALRTAILRQRAARQAAKEAPVPRPVPQHAAPQRQYNPPPITSNDPALYPRRDGFRLRHGTNDLGRTTKVVGLIACTLLLLVLLWAGFMAMDPEVAPFLDDEDPEAPCACLLVPVALAGVCVFGAALLWRREE